MQDNIRYQGTRSLTKGVYSPPHILCLALCPSTIRHFFHKINGKMLFTLLQNTGKLGKILGGTFREHIKEVHSNGC